MHVMPWSACVLPEAWAPQDCLKYAPDVPLLETAATQNDNGKVNVKLPLDGVRILDFSRVLAGPMATMTLGDLGAEVIKVEAPLHGDDTRDWGAALAPGDTSYFYGFNRNKKSIALDLGSLVDRSVALELAAKADVIVENFKAGGLDRLGLGLDLLRERNPGLIYCAISGYDRYGPEAERPGYDLLVQGEAGLMMINGEEGRPPLKFGLAIADMMTGMYATQAILAALFERQRTGTGRKIELSLYDCALATSSYVAIETLHAGRDIPRYGNFHPSIVPYGVVHASDGPMIIAVGNNRQFRDFCALIGQPDLADDDCYATNIARSINRESLMSILEPIIARLKCQDILNRMAAAGIPAGEILGLYDALTNPRTADCEMIKYCAHPVAGEAPVLSPPFRLDGQRLPVSRPPRLDEHGDEIRSRLGMSDRPKPASPD